MKLLRLAPLVLTLMTGAASAQAPLTLPEIDYIRVAKSARTMQLYSAGQLAHTSQGIQLGDAPMGHKRFQGDERTPEGRYTIDYGNPASSYYLSLHISYPNDDIVIHANDIKSCFHQIKHHPDIVGAFSYVLA